MAKFRFPLEAVLKYRGLLEDQAKRDFAEAQGHVDDARARLDQMYARADEVREEIAASQRAGSAHAIELVRESEHFLLGHAQRIQAARQGLSHLLGILEEKHEALMNAARQKNVLAQLREKRRVEFVAKLNRIEAMELDEIATLRHARGKR